MSCLISPLILLQVMHLSVLYLSLIHIWEGAQSVPDIEKILQISKLFGVTTDYLLKDEMGEPEYAESEYQPVCRRRYNNLPDRENIQNNLHLVQK